MEESVESVLLELSKIRNQGWRVTKDDEQQRPGSPDGCGVGTGRIRNQAGSGAFYCPGHALAIARDPQYKGDGCNPSGSVAMNQIIVASDNKTHALRERLMDALGMTKRTE